MHSTFICKMSVQTFSPFFKKLNGRVLFLNFGSLHISWIQILWYICYKSFLLVCFLPFHFLSLSFQEQKILKKWYLTCPQHVEVPRPRIKSMPQQTLNPRYHEWTPKDFMLVKFSISTLSFMLCGFVGFFGYACSMQTFLGQGSHLCHSSNLSQSNDKVSL